MSTTKPHQNVQQVIQEAQQLLQAQHFNRAIQHLSNCRDKHMEQHPEFWQVWGLALLMNDHVEDSLSYLAQSAVMQPENARYQSNYGEALRRTEQFNKARKHLIKAVSMSPDYQAAIYNLACTELALKQFKPALKRLKKLLKLNPKQAYVHVALADTLRQVGRYKMALHHYSKALDLQPDHATALSHYGWLLLHTGRLDEALDCSRRAVELNPNDVDVLFHLGRCLTELEHYDEAMDVFADAYEIDSGHVDLLNAIGHNWLKVGNIEQADHWFHLALQQDPDNIKAHCGHGQSLMEIGLIDDALSAINKVAEKHPNEKEVLLTRAKIYLDQMNLSACYADYDKVILQHRNNGRIHAAYGHALEAGGDLQAAQKQFELALNKNPHCIPALSGLAVTQKKTFNKDYADIMHDLLQQQSVRAGAQAQLHTGLGYYYDGQGDYCRAAEHINQANNYKLVHNERTQKAYQPSKYRQYIDRVINTFDARYFKELEHYGSDTEQPVFIVGMPRSGTTLTEQILNAHPNIVGVGEQPLIGQSFNDLPAAADHPDASAFDIVQHITGESLQKIALWHADKTKKLIGHRPEISRVVDKMPDNYSQIGWILTLFPNAKIIHAKRDLRDVAVSCWMTQFAKINWAFDPDHIADRMIQYHRMMQHWLQVLPDKIITTEYEQLVENPAYHSRRLIKALGLEWHSDCLNFHQQKNIIRTASVTQVRQPIYQKSVNRWQRYQIPLKSLFERLEKAGLIKNS